MAKGFKKIDLDRRKFLLTATSVTGAIGVSAMSVPFVSSMFPSEKAKAAGSAVEFNTNLVNPGEMKTTEWRGQPVWILNRSEKMLKTLDNITNLADPSLEVTSQQPKYCQNATRSIKPNVLVVVGICTHLGCSPSPKLTEKGDMGNEWEGGFYCACHGSRFDLSGRVHKGSPAPTNLVVPPHKYIGDNNIVIGEDQEEKS
jgi:ubiquinol-cytochrome c reductase iron-sulfur subunit